MKLYVLTFSVGLSSGFSEMIGIYDSMEALEKGKEKDKNKDCFRKTMDGNYRIYEVEVNKNINVVYCDW